MQGFGFVSSPGLKQVDGMRRQMRGLPPRERTPKTGLKEAEDEGKFLLLVPDEYCCSPSPVLMSFTPSVPSDHFWALVSLCHPLRCASLLLIAQEKHPGLEAAKPSAQDNACCPSLVLRHNLPHEPLDGLTALQGEVGVR